MKKLFFFLFALISLICYAQTPDIRIKTDIYKNDGPTNSFTLVLGAAPGKNGYADVKCSGGNQSEVEIISAYYDQESQALIGSYISCQVDEEGIVEVFCDDDVVIDYISCTGADITSVEIKNPGNIEIMAFEHNLLESLDLTPFINLQALYLYDNPMNVSPLTDKGEKNKLTVLDISLIENIDPEFDITKYPNLRSFDAMSTHGLSKLTPSACPLLQKISIDNTSVATLDVTQNPELLILNISESRIKEIDLSGNPKLQQFYATHSSAFNTDIKLSKIDVSNNQDLIYLFLNDNNISSIDLSNCPYLQDLYIRNNKLTSIDLSNNKELINVFITGNYMDFNTLPIPQETWADYDLSQKPLYVPASYLVGTEIDLSKHLVRKDSETHANVFYIREDDPANIYTMDSTLYSFKDGKLVIYEVIADSVYASFFNATFPDTELVTTMFRTKDESTYGKPELAASFSNSIKKDGDVSFYVGVIGASANNPKTFYVDLGDGELKEFTATTENTPSEPNVCAKKPKAGAIKIYVADGDNLTALKVTDVQLSTVDLSKSVQLRELSLVNTKLKHLDLKWNRSLRSIDITGNDFGSSFTLAGANGYYGKNFLNHINLSNNNLSSIKLNEPGAWKYIDLSHNNLTTLDFTDADYLQYLDISHNNFDYLKINYCGELKTLLCNNNILTSIFMPETNVIETLDCSNNCFVLSNLPERNGLDEQHYIYAPQADIQIPSIGPGYNLSKQYVTIDGKSTVFTWKTSEGETLTEGKDYTCNGGITLFDDCTIGKTLYCEISHPAYPAFTGENILKTSSMYSAGMPTHLLGTFKTLDNDKEVNLSLASLTPNNSIYIDWTGTNSLEQYPLATTYTAFTATTTAGATVKVWSYEENDNLSVFSLSNARLTDVDLSPMTNLICLSLSFSGIRELKYPESPNLRELSLDGNNFSSFDFSLYPKLSFINFDNNKFDAANLSGLNQLGTAAFANNGLQEITLSENTGMWQLSLANNKLENIDLSGAPNIEQLFLNGNKLSSIDLSVLQNLRVVYLDNNRFDFSNLPIPQEQWALYTYGNQPDLVAICEDGKVDLSSQAKRDTVETVYTWFYGEPTIDTSTGEISGEILELGEEYIIEGGVTTFLCDLDQVCCVLTNKIFPSTFLKTNVIPVTGITSIEEVANDIETEIHTLNGTRVSKISSSGIFIINGKIKFIKNN